MDAEFYGEQKTKWQDTMLDISCFKVTVHFFDKYILRKMSQFLDFFLELIHSKSSKYQLAKESTKGTYKIGLPN